MYIMKRENDCNVLDLFADFHNEVDRAFNRSVFTRDGLTGGFGPLVDIREESDHYILHSDLPGLKKENINISLQANALTLSGERKLEKEEKEKGYYYAERSYGSFSRRIEFPTDIDSTKVKATYSDGVLELILPKVENAKPKQISIDVK
ncbi:MAG: Hsp20/alpha crystallin family protein [Chlamydiota bacterium]|nr:Hsp20/alpha crystallin family protein [Chlamydiota bacterium]